MRDPRELYWVRRHLGFSWEEWRGLPKWKAEYYWQLLLEDLLPDPDSEAGWDDWSDDPNVA